MPPSNHGPGWRWMASVGGGAIILLVGVIFGNMDGRIGDNAALADQNKDKLTERGPVIDAAVIAIEKNSIAIDRIEKQGIRTQMTVEAIAAAVDAKLTPAMTGEVVE